MLTKKQKRILDYIKKYVRKNDYAPTLEEIKRHFRLSAVSGVHQYINVLKHKGYLNKNDSQPRAIQIIKNQFLNKIQVAGMISAGYVSSGIETLTPPKFEEDQLELIHKPNNDKTFLTKWLNTVQHMDCVEGLKKLPDESCDIIIIDPPYNIGKDFGNNIDKRELSEYVQWSKNWIYEAIRLIKSTGTIFIYGFSEILAFLSVEIPINKRWLIWHYTNKNVASLNFWQRSHESILCAWKDKPIFNKDEVREPYTEGFLNGAAGRVRKGTVGRFSKNGEETVYNAHEGGALPRDVIKTPALAGGAGMIERWFFCKTCDDVFEPRKLKKHLNHNTIKHPTQKPLNLTRKLIKSAMPKKEGVVLVPFVGSGSECVATKNLGLSYLGFELNPDYVRIAEKWLKNTQSTPHLF